jgi:flagellar motility protein MotE (MotC chaperone)
MKSLRLLFAFVLVATLSFAIRIGEFVHDVRGFEMASIGSAIAADKTEKAVEGEEAQPSVDVPEGLPETEASPLPETDWADPITLDMQFTETQTRVLKELKERRDALDTRESQMNQREALLQVTERRIEEKIAELEQIRTDMKNLLGQQSEEEEARLRSLVKIYEGMKPTQAASIFDNLDMDILLQVVGRMSERRTAPILASMDVKKAQELTTLLAEQKQLPDMPLD